MNVSLFALAVMAIAVGSFDDASRTLGFVTTMPMAVTVAVTAVGHGRTGLFHEQNGQMDGDDGHEESRSIFAEHDEDLRRSVKS